MRGERVSIASIDRVIKSLPTRPDEHEEASWQSPVGVVTEYSIPTIGSYPHGITAGLDGALWSVESSGNKVGRITTAGVFTAYPVPTPDGAVWFTEVNANQIGRVGGIVPLVPSAPISAPAFSTMPFVALCLLLLAVSAGFLLRRAVAAS